MGVYSERVALDHVLVTWARNPRSLPPREVFSLAIGTSLEF